MARSHDIRALLVSPRAVLGATLTEASPSDHSYGALGKVWGTLDILMGFWTITWHKNLSSGLAFKGQHAPKIPCLKCNVDGETKTEAPMASYVCSPETENAEKNLTY